MRHGATTPQGDLREIWWSRALLSRARGAAQRPVAPPERAGLQRCGAVALRRCQEASPNERRHRHELGREAFKVVTEHEEGSEHEGGAVKGRPRSRVELGELRAREQRGSATGAAAAARLQPNLHQLKGRLDHRARGGGDDATHDNA